jgi:hypothetical protein
LEISPVSNPALRTGINASIAAIIGILLSGPVGLLVVNAVQPNVAWVSGKVFAEHYHPIQTFPFFCGFIMIGGFIVMIAAIYQVAGPQEKLLALVAVMLTAAFSTLIFFNYINQTTFIPALARNYKPEYEPVMSAFSFVNFNSLCWAIEMWGYALLGVATWLVAPVFNRNRIEKITAGLMIANGIISLLGGFITAIDLGWVGTMPGFILYLTWNLVVLLMAIFVILSFRIRQK